MNGKTGHVMALSNSIIGVGILAMPFCFQKCGIILSILLLIASNFITRISCYYLVKSSILCRRKSFEIMAFHAFGSQGKLLVELSIIGFLMGTCVTYFVVLGDLGPQMVAKILGIENNDVLRTWTMVMMTVFFVIPLSLLRNVDSLSAVCTASIGFYFCLVVKVMAESQNHFTLGDWVKHVEYWKPSGVLQCLPIISMALFCQLQLFEVFETVQNVSLEKMYGIVKSATAICTSVYVLVGFFGYISYCRQEFSGNILLNFSPSFTNDIIKIGFVLSIAFSFPLVIFPCRVSVYSLLYRRGHADVAHYIPEHRFKFITIALVTFGLVIGIMIPSVELVIGLVGSTIGIAICVIFPASCFIKICKKDSTEKALAQVILVFGFFLMVLGTYANLAAIEEKTSGLPHNDGKLHKDHIFLTNRTKNISIIDIEHKAKKNHLITKKTVEQIEINLVVSNIPQVQANLNRNAVQRGDYKPNTIEAKTVLNKNDRVINYEAIQKEDTEIGIDNLNKHHGKAKKTKIVKTVNNKLQETKELLKERVDEIKIELEKRNQETQKLVQDKFNEIVEKLDQKHDDTQLINNKIPMEELNNKIMIDIKELRENIKLPPTQTHKSVEEIIVEKREGTIDDTPAKVLKKVEEIVDKVEKIEQTQQENRLRQVQNPSMLNAKKPHHAVLEKVERIAERIDKIQKVQENENFNDLAQLVVATAEKTFIIPSQVNTKGNQYAKITTTTTLVPINNVPMQIAENAIVVKQVPPIIDNKAGDTNRLMEKIEAIVEKVEQIEQHQEKELHIINKKNMEIIVEQKKPDSVAETNKLVLKKIEEIGEKLDVIELKQKQANLIKQVANEILPIAPTIKNDIVKKIPDTTMANTNEPKIETLTVDINQNKTVNTINETGKAAINIDLTLLDRKNGLPPLPLLVRNLSLHDKKNVIENQTIHQVSPNQLPNQVPAKELQQLFKITPAQVTEKPQEKQIKITQHPPTTMTNEKHVEAIRRDLLAINIANNLNHKNTTFDIEINQQNNQRVKRNIHQLINCTNANNQPNLCTKFISLENKQPPQIPTNFNEGKKEHIVIGRELKSFNKNVTVVR